MSIRQTQRRITALDDDICLQPFGQTASFREPFIAVNGMAVQTVEFLRMGRHDYFLWQLLYPRAVVAKDIDGVGIRHYRTLRPAELRYESYGRRLVHAEPWSYAKSVEVFRVHRLGEYGLIGIRLYDCFRHGNLSDDIVAPRRMDRNLSRTGPETGPCGQHGRSAHAVASGHYQGVAHLTLVGKFRTGPKKIAHLVLLHYMILGIDAIHTLTAQPYVQNTKLADEYLVFGKRKESFLC